MYILMGRVGKWGGNIVYERFFCKGIAGPINIEYVPFGLGLIGLSALT